MCETGIDALPLARALFVRDVREGYPQVTDLQLEIITAAFDDGFEAAMKWVNEGRLILAGAKAPPPP